MGTVTIERVGAQDSMRKGRHRPKEEQPSPVTGNTQGSVLFGLINLLFEEFLKAVYFCIMSLYTFNLVCSSYYNFFPKVIPMFNILQLFRNFLNSVC